MKLVVKAILSLTQTGYMDSSASRSFTKNSKVQVGLQNQETYRWISFQIQSQASCQRLSSKGWPRL